MEKISKKFLELKNIIKSFLSKNKKLSTILCVAILLPIVLLIFTSFSPTNRNLKKLNTLANEINLANDNLKLAINDNSINPEISKQVLSSNLIELERIKNELSTLDLTSLDTTQKAILKTLDTNINLFKISLELYTNPKTSRLEDKINEYNKNLDSFYKEVENISKLGVKNIISKDSESFFKFTKTYFQTLLEMNNLTQINNETKRNFITSLNGIITNFNKINEDLKPAIEDIYKNNRSLDTLITDIENKKNTLNKIKEEYFCLSVPEDALSLQKSIENLIDIYGLYITELKESISSSLESSINACSKYDDFSKLYDKFLKDLDKYKNS